MAVQGEAHLTQLGFRFGINGPHAARTMMLNDLRLLLAHTSPQSKQAEYVSAIVDSNVLGKPTRKSRTLAVRHLSTLYAFNLANPIFRALRRLWPLNEAAQPMLALAVATARDPLLRNMQAFIVNQPPGNPILRQSVEAFLESTHPERFSAASRQSFARNLAGTWTMAGLLQGHLRKKRAKPLLQPEAVAMLLFLGYLEGRSGQRLFTSEWTKLLGVPVNEIASLACSASHRGLLVFMNAAGLQEVRFPDYLTAQEEQIRQELAHVI